MSKTILSKSTFIKGKQCHKQLYLYKHRYFLRDKMPPELLATFNRGSNIGLLAQKLFPGGVDCSPKSPSQYSKAVENTWLNVQNGAKVIYEAGFIHNQTIVLLDILVNDGDGFSAYEVKSSISISETYLEDAALQYYVISNTGIKLNSFSLITVNPDYILDGELDLENFFSIEDVTDMVQEKLKDIEVEVNAQIAVVGQASSPKIDLGKHCFEPYRCEFVGHCWGERMNDKSMNLPNLTLSERVEIFEGGIDVLAGNQKFVLSKKWYDFDGTAPVFLEFNFREKISWQTHFSLAKTVWVKSALPLFEGNKPYQKVGVGIAYAIVSVNDFKLKSFEIKWFKPNEIIGDDFNKVLVKLNLEGQILTFDERSDWENEIINIYDLLAKGELMIAGLHDFKFRNVFKALKGREPYFAGNIRVDEQITPYYSKYLNSKSKSDLADVESYLKDSLEFLASMVKSLLVK